MANLESLYKVYPLYRELFLEQLQFALSPNRLNAALCSSRAGKTTVCAIIGIQELLNNPNSIGMYLALTKESVRNIFLPTIRPILRKYNVKCKITADEISFDNGSVLMLTGAHNQNVVETFRGLKLKFCIIDEAASFEVKLLKYLIDEVIMLRLADLQGKLMLIGTPAQHCSGLFYDVTELNQPGWNIFKWTCFDNPFTKDALQKSLDLDLLRKQCDINDAKIQREYFGNWRADKDELMIKPFITCPSVSFDKKHWRTVIGIDIGFNDETAMTVIGWEYNNPKAYVLKSIGKRGQAVSDIAKMIIELKEFYGPASIVMDPAGSSKILMEEFSRKYHINITPAHKTDKAHYIEIMNDALLNHVLVLVASDTKELQQEMKKVVWNDEHTREKEGQDCDKLDATLYAYRAALHYLEQIPVRVVMDEFALSKQMEQQAIEQWYEREEAKRPDKFYDDLTSMIDD